MKKLIIFLIIIGIVWFSYSYLRTHVHVNLMQTVTSTLGISDYRVETGMRVDTPGEDITVYDNKGNKVLSLINEDPQYVKKLVWDKLIVDIGTSAGSRTMDIYDLATTTKIFTTNYYGGMSNAISIDGNIVTYYYKVWNEMDGLETKPMNAPACSELYNGYVEVRSYNLKTQTMIPSWTLTCAYFE